MDAPLFVNGQMNHPNAIISSLAQQTAYSGKCLAEVEEMSASDTVYVAGLPLDTTEHELAQYFGQTGAIKTDQQTGLLNIWIYKDGHTGLPKGDAIVSYQDPYAAASAIQYFHQRPLRGRRSPHFYHLCYFVLAPRFNSSCEFGGGADRYDEYWIVLCADASS